MRKIIRLTESDLTRIVRRVINEEITGYDENEIESLNKFLSYIKPKGKNGYWKQERVNSSVVVKLPSNARIANLGGFDINKPLNWVLYDINNDKVDGTQFQIYKSQGELFWSYLNSSKMLQGSEKLIGNERSALKMFNNIAGSY